MQDALEYLHEAVKELEDQPETNLTREEIEEKYWLLMVGPFGVTMATIFL